MSIVAEVNLKIPICNPALRMNCSYNNHFIYFQFRQTFNALTSAFRNYFKFFLSYSIIKNAFCRFSSFFLSIFYFSLLNIFS